MSTSSTRFVWPLGIVAAIVIAALAFVAYRGGADGPEAPSTAQADAVAHRSANSPSTPRNSADLASAAALARDPNASAVFERHRMCLQAETAKRIFSQPNEERDALLNGPEPPGLTSQQKARRAADIAALTQMLDAIDRSQTECVGLQPSLSDGSMYGIALRAATSGDQSAANCYVSTFFPIPDKMSSNKQAFETYRVNALSLIDSGIHSGNWVMVGLASQVYADRRGDTWLYRIAEPDRVAVYRFTKLQELGAPDAEMRARRQAALALEAKELDPADVGAAERWAHRTYDTYFAAKSPRDTADVICH